MPNRRARGPNYAIVGGGTNSFETPPVAILVMPRPLGGTITRSANYLIAQIAGMRWRMKKFPEKMVSATALNPSFFLPSSFPPHASFEVCVED